jgi:molecular chaperone GrpE (heat shock protein)
MTVVGETARGYMIGSRVLRPAMVTVAMVPESARLDADGSAT